MSLAAAACDLIVTMGRHQRDLFGLPGRGGRHRVHLPGAEAGVHRQGDAAASTPTVAATTSTPPRQAARSPRIDTPSGRALHQLGIEHIAAYSPEAAAAPSAPSAPSRTASSRNWRWRGSRRSKPQTASSQTPTCPTTTAASRPRPNSKTAPSCPSNTPARSTTSSVAAQTARSPATTPCATKGASSRSPRARHHYVKATVRVHEYPDGTVALFHGPRRLARYNANGEPIETPTRQAA